jgi:Protein of unknwon function (DUF3310)
MGDRKRIGGRGRMKNERPGHYASVGIDAIDVGKENFTPEEMNGFYKMNVVKYTLRCDRKNGLDDLKKAQNYLELLIQNYEEAQEPPPEFWEGQEFGQPTPAMGPWIKQDITPERGVVKISDLYEVVKFPAHPYQIEKSKLLNVHPGPMPEFAPPWAKPKPTEQQEPSFFRKLINAASKAAENKKKEGRK